MRIVRNDKGKGLMVKLVNLVWYVVEVKEDVKCSKIPDNLCTFPIYNDNHNVNKHFNNNNNKDQDQNQTGRPVV